MIVDLTPEIESRLQQEATRQGTDPMQIARSLIEKGLGSMPQQGEKRDRTLELLTQWAKEDATDDEEELARRDAELEAFKANMNANRAACGEKPLY